MFELFALLSETDIELTVLAEKETQNGKGFDVSLYHRESKACCRMVILYTDMAKFSAEDIVKLHFKPMMAAIKRNKNLVMVGEQS